jgi:hypothetical protein
MYKLFHRYTITNNSIYYLVNKSFIRPAFDYISSGVIPNTTKTFTFYKDCESSSSMSKHVYTHNLKLFKEVSYDEVIFLYDMGVCCKKVIDELDLILLNWDIN